MTVLLATNNEHKTREFAQILKHHRVVMPRDIGLRFEYEETADTFLENAFGKARALFKLLASTTGQPEATENQTVVIADDSGLCVDALGGAPGIYSARYGSADGEELPAQERNALLLEKLGNTADRGAFFVCCMVALRGGERFAVVQETFEGVIAREPSGGGGFGYDPVFFLPERACTVAEMPESEKNRISHRGKATAAIAKLLESPAGGA